MLAFLSLRDGQWITDGLSYGTLYPSAEERAVLRNAARAILSVQPGDEQGHAALLVQLAVHRATRWDGLFELAPEGDLLHDYYRHRAPEGDARKLTAAQLDAAAAGFVAEPSGDQTVAMELMVLRDHPDTAFDRTVAGIFDALLELDGLPWWFAQAFDLGVARLAPGAATPAHQGFLDADLKVYRQAWAPIRRQLERRGPIPKIKLPSFGSAGVGRRTPS